jgi:hypothetical protein
MAAGASRRALRTPPRATRAKPVLSYAESSSGSELGEDYDDVESEVETIPPPTRSRSTAKTPTPAKKRQPSARTYDSEDDERQRASKKRKASKPSSPKAQPNDQIIHGSGVVPPWQELPYQILVHIFQYASYPLYDERSFNANPSNQWLLNVAKLCRAFAEPAFTVLYASPPLVPMVKAHMLVDLLKADPLPMAFKYRQKVESLLIEVHQVAAYSLPGSGLLDLEGMIKNLPRLATLEFYHKKDFSPYRNLDDTFKWTYPDTLFEALEYIDPKADPLRGDKTSVCNLKSWRWSSRLAGKKYPIEKIRELHLKPSFAALKKIAFVNYQVPVTRKGGDDPKLENILAESLRVLPNLEHLIFESSTLVNAKLLPMLPTNLRNLELINCWEIIASDFAEFLFAHGSQLRCLTLDHNQSLSLSFLPTLGSACPKLQVLRMNLVYYNLHATYRDSDPQYDQLLFPSEVPVWPSTLQTIELTNLRKWETEAAEMFFQSLLDSAATLPDLRRLTIQATLNIGWRDRASFRDKWVGSLNRIFKRVSALPKVHISSSKPFLIPGKSAIRESPTQQTNEGKDASATKRPSLRSSSGGNTASSPSQPMSRRTPRTLHDGHNQQISQPRRSGRTSTRHSQQAGIYAESSENSDIEIEEFNVPSSRDVSRRGRLERELGILREAAGIGSPKPSMSSPPQTHASDDSENEPQGTEKGKGKQKEAIQGMCDIVNIRIDNLRPTEVQATEADFLDEEPSGDEDWNGDEGMDDGYAW